MKTNYTYLLSFLLLFSTSTVWSQTSDQAVNPCGISEKMDEYFKDHPEMESVIKAYDKELEEFTQQFINSRIEEDTLIVPVVFHIIHMNGPENISRDVVLEAMARLNIDFAAENSDIDQVVDEFQGIIPVTNIHFRLATIDPNGNCTNGVTRTYSTETLTGDQPELGQLIQWPRNKYLNIYIVADIEGSAGGGIIAGYTYRPPFLNDNPIYDGIVINDSFLGANERTLTHEVGHWINLLHVWGDGSNPGLPDNCSMDDFVNDTPLCIGDLFTCVTSSESCGSLDNVQNYMNYATCKRNFTQGQSDRMRASLSSTLAERNNLWTEGNLASTGTDVEPALCAADFHTDRTVVCMTDTIEFFDDSYNGVISTWSWTFEGGTPATSDIENPVVTYANAEAGTYDVKLTVGDGVNEVTTVKTNFIDVLRSGVEIPYNETFETVDSFPSEDWFLISEDNTQWEITTDAAAVGSNSAFLHNYIQSDGEIDQLVYSTVDLSGLTAAEISFKYAYVKKHEDDRDVLKLGISRNCGDSWIIKKRIKATTGVLVTADDQLSEFTPSTDEWREMVVTLSELYYIENFRYKFQFENGGGNNVYVDDIKIYDPSVVGIKEVNKAALNYNVYPNPINSQLNVEFNLLERTHVLGEIFDVTGRKIETLFDSDYSLGTHRVDYNLSDMKAGVYFVKITLEGESFTKSVIKN